MKQKDALYFIGILIYLSRITIAVPVSRHTRDVFLGNKTSLAEDECVSEDIIYKAGDEVPSPGPCEKCVCQPPKVECTMIKCKTNSGCKMIQRSNHCCPDFMCDCEYKGRVYNNGERLELEDTQCQVCYCKGGEIMCTSITCYERADCEPKYVPGQCCPRYDHCPLENNDKNSTNATVIGSKREIQPWLMTNAVTVKPIKDVKQSSTKPQEDHTPPNVYPQTLKIHEVVPTTAKYERFPNGKRPILTPVEKSPVEVRSSTNTETSTAVNNEMFSTENDLITSTDRMIFSADDINLFVSTFSPSLSTSDVKIDEENIVNSNNTFEFISSTPGSVTTETSNYESISRDDVSSGENDTKGNLIDVGTTDITKEMNDLEKTDSIQPSSEESFTDSFVANDELSPTINSITLSDEPVSNSDLGTVEEIADTSSVTLQTDSLILDGGIYDELNVTFNEDIVKKDEPVDDKEQTTTSSERNDSYESTTPSDVQNIDTFVPSQNRRSGEWISDNYQMFPEDNVEDADEDTLIDLNVGATSHSDTRVSPNYFFNEDYKDTYFQNGRSLAPSLEKSSEKSIDSEEMNSNESKYDKNDISVEDSSSEEANETSNELKTKLADAINLKINKDEKADLYLSITGTNISSNEIVLRMILSPTDLKQLAEQLVKESNKQTSFKETNVKLEWLTKDQLKEIKQMNPTSLFSLSRCNITMLTDIKSDKSKDKISDQLSLDSNKNIYDMSTEAVTSGETSSEMFDTTTPLYSTTTNSDTTLGPAGKSQLKSEIETSTIKIYEIRPSSDVNDKFIESYRTTEGPYSSDKIATSSDKSPSSSSDKDYLDFYQSDKSEDDRAKSNINENTTDGNDIETSTYITKNIDKSRKKNLPNVEPFLRQLPSTLDEKDVSILRDFLEKHLSEPHDR